AYIGPTAQVATVGDYMTGHAGRVPVVVVRNEQGLGGFVNVCRHRRHQVMKGSGNATFMQCPYHPWHYDLAGTLRRVPRVAAEPDLDMEALGLLSARVETLGPFVFVNLDRQAPSLAECYGPVLELMAGAGLQLDRLEVHSREDWRFEANWKTM